ncbi:MAG: hypothetical protein LBB49_03025 [Gracilibacteraceae bacterium]|nr:hypothetical protein [Gracilibacteraceae bacterium]
MDKADILQPVDQWTMRERLAAGFGSVLETEWNLRRWQGQRQRQRQGQGQGQRQGRVDPWTILC